MQRLRFLLAVLVLGAIVIFASGCGAGGPSEVSGVVINPDTGDGISGVPV